MKQKKNQRKKKINNLVAKQDFTYTGNPPTSRESAILMIADSVEAASHSVKILLLKNWAFKFLI